MVTRSFRRRWSFSTWTLFLVYNYSVHLGFSFIPTRRNSIVARGESTGQSSHRQPDRDQDLGSSPVATDHQKCLPADNNVSFPNAGFAHRPLSYLHGRGGLHSFHTPC